MFKERRAQKELLKTTEFIRNIMIGYFTNKDSTTNIKNEWMGLTAGKIPAKYKIDELKGKLTLFTLSSSPSQVIRHEKKQSKVIHNEEKNQP